MVTARLVPARARPAGPVRRPTALVALSVLLVSVLLPLSLRPSSATFSSEVSGIVFQDFNSNGVMNTTAGQGVATDVPVAGIVVRAFGAAGDELGTATTTAGGTYLLDLSVPNGTPVRVEFTIPTDVPALEGLQPSSAAAPGATGTTAGTSVQFTTTGSTGVNFAVLRPGEYCQDNPTLATCLMLPADAAGLTAPGPFLVPTTSLVSGNLVQGVDSALPWNGTTRKATADAAGAVFGIGVDRSGTATTAANAFLGTYVKRHVEYGFNGATNTIYRLTLPEEGLGDLSVFVTLPGTLPAHDPTGVTGALSTIPYSGDVGVFDRVGRIGLGDVDVTPDGRTLLAVDMDESAPKLWFVPILGTGDDVTAGVPVSRAIPKPATFSGVACPGTWHPMGIGVRGERILVGGVCGAEDTVTPATPRGGAPTASTAFVLEWDAAMSSFSTIFAMSLDYPRGCAIWENCPSGPAASLAGEQMTARWGAWNEYPAWVEYTSTLMKASNPQAMLSNIEIADDGALILNFRDRFGDQSKSNLAAYSKAYEAGSEYTAPPLAFGARADTFSAGEILRVCNAGGTLTLEADGTCAGSSITGSGRTDASGRKEFYYDNYPHLASGSYHPETANGSSATMPGYAGVWITGWDMSNVNQQAIISLGDCATRFGDGPCYPSDTTTGYGSRIGGVSLRTSASGLTWGLNASFDKGNGLADLEVVCDQTPMQIGNRVWIDTDRDGIQDPDEPAVAGVTVRLYDADGRLVGTAVTDANGQYLFSSLVVEPADGGASPDSVGGGLVAGTAYTIRFDEPADYGPDGPLRGYFPTVADAVASDPDAFADGVDSDAMLVGTGTYGTDLFPSIEVPALEPGVNDHSFDVGFVPLVAVGDRVWVDDDRDGLQDPTEGPIAGTVVTLYLPDGTPALRADGSPATTVAAADGTWVIDLLHPGEYYAVFQLPLGFAFTGDLAGGGANPTTDSDADPVTGATPVFTLSATVGGNMGTAPGSAFAVAMDPTIDAGATPPIPVVVGVGDRVWIDIDRDGLQGSDVMPLAGVTVTLYAADGVTPIIRFDGSPATAVSAADGSWFIDRLAPGDYVAVFELPQGYQFTTAGVGGDPTGDSDVDPATGRTGVFTVEASATGDTIVDATPLTVATFANLTIDVGVTPIPSVLVAMGSRVWIDADVDGIQGPGEAPIAGVIVTLYEADGVTPVIRFDGTPATAVTDADGNYFIDGLLPGEYRALFSGLPHGYGFTRQTVGSDDAADSNPDPATGMTAVFTIHASATGSTIADTDPSTLAFWVDPTIDAGVVPLVAVGDVVWFDYQPTGYIWDSDGLYESTTERGAEGVLVVLYEQDGVTPATRADGTPAEATTDASGRYLIDGLLPGTYRAKFHPPVGYALATNATTPTDLNSDPDQVTKLTPPFTLTASATGAMTAVTDGSIDAVFIDRTVDAGLVRAMAFSGILWIDADGDGFFDEDELPMPGVTVYLRAWDNVQRLVLGPDGEPLTVTTGPDGRYLFDDLPVASAGTQVWYRAELSPPPGYTMTTTATGLNFTNYNRPDDSNFDSSGNSGWRYIETLSDARFATLNTGTDATAMYYDEHVDGGFRPRADLTVGVGDLTWIDSDGDGLQDADEAPLAGVLVELFLPDGVTPATRADGTPATATSDADGRWFIDGLLAGEYRARFTPPDGYVFTTAGAGDDGALDSDPDPSTGMTATFSILPYAWDDTTLDTDVSTLATYANLTIDAGFVPFVSVGDYVWFDVDGDGLQDETDVPLEGVTLTITKADGSAVTDIFGNAVTSTTTDADGRYTFDHLPFGEYVVTVTPPTGYVATLAGAGADAAIDSSTGSATSASLSAGGERDDTLDFGFTALVAVGDVVWIDSDGNGRQDPGEPPLPRMTVQLFLADGATPATRADGSPAVAVTDDEGRYVIDGLLPGTYRALFSCTCDFTTALAAGVDGDADSDADVTTGMTAPFTLTAAVTGSMVANTDPAIDARFIDPTIDAGVLPEPSVSVGDYVWFDVNGDGLQDGTDVPLAGVTLTITNLDGSAVTDVYGSPVTTTVTDADGRYSFDNLPFGTYVVTVTAPAGYLPTLSGEGEDGAVDSSDASATSVELTVDGQRDPTLDFGFVVDPDWVHGDGDGEGDGTDGGEGGSDGTGEETIEALAAAVGGPRPTRIPAGGGGLPHWWPIGVLLGIRLMQAARPMGRTIGWSGADLG